MNVINFINIGYTIITSIINKIPKLKTVVFQNNGNEE